MGNIPWQQTSLQFARQNQTNFATIFLPLLLLLLARLVCVRNRLKKFTHFHFAKRSKIMRNCCARRGERGKWKRRQLKCLQLHTRQHATTKPLKYSMCRVCVAGFKCNQRVFYAKACATHTHTHVLVLCAECACATPGVVSDRFQVRENGLKITAALYSWLLNANISCHMSLANAALWACLCIEVAATYTHTYTHLLLTRAAAI